MAEALRRSFLPLSLTVIEILHAAGVAGQCIGGDSTLAKRIMRILELPMRTDFDYRVQSSDSSTVDRSAMSFMNDEPKSCTAIRSDSNADMKRQDLKTCSHGMWTNSRLCR